ncbi:uncharacterized protein LOC133517655 [Cydia pomonella]|uniref:uncharacterized protein LOC133517655 n=1 Tax=Cydia pomonella TaxID=82600 RepID=UPI002ADD89F8|nr:uncharacterized protein LOC133517655 [Cydia pomonella]
MAKDTRNIESVDSAYYEDELSMLEAKRNIFFELVQGIYKKSLVVDTDLASRESFLDAADTIDELRSEFKEVVNEYNRTLLRARAAAVPNYQPIIAFEDLYCRIRRVVKRLQPAAPPASSLPSIVERARPSLPTMELVAFDGDIRNWPLFYASFKSRVHENLSLTDEEKLFYLIGKLSPKAQAVIAGITPSAENYQLIIDSLIDRFQDKRTLASTYMDQMLNLKINGPASSSNFQTFIDKFVTAANALKSLKLDDLCDFMLLHMALKKLDQETLRAFEMLHRDTKLPTFRNLTDFMKSQFRIYQNVQPSTVVVSAAANPSREKGVKSSQPRSAAPKLQSYVACASTTKCICDNIVHEHLFKCPSLNSLTPSERFKRAKELKACVNCLSIKHRTRECNSEVKCRVCHQKHHTLLHFDKDKDERATTSDVSSVSASAVAKSSSPPPESTSCNTSIVTQALAASNNKMSKQNSTSSCDTVLLSTAKVIVRDNKGGTQVVKCLLDTASQSNFITEECCKRLGLNFDKKPSAVFGIGKTKKIVMGNADIKIFSRFDENVNFDVSSFVVDRITDDLPSVPVDMSTLTHVHGLPLADDTLDTPVAIDVLVGATIFPHLLLPHIVKSDVDYLPPAIQTVLGYILMGSVPALQSPRKYTSACCTSIQDSTDNLLKRFWELEEISAPPAQSQDDLECEDYFRATTTRDANGRYTVALPFRDDVFKLGESHSAAKRRFLCLERKLESSSVLRAAYDDIIREYVSKGYISEVTISMKASPAVAYIIPHHAVIREDKSTTKVRMVLDSSSKTSTGLSLNDVLHSGPNLQGDLFSILLNFRLFKIALSADCRQMFLQIGVREAERKFQRILYRFRPADPITTYEFNRVCFGMKSSPYHALRVVRQLIADDGHKYPTAAAIASSCTYMDDVCFSIMSDDSQQQDESVAIAAAKELIDLFKCGQFDLVKWTCNSDAVLREIPASHRASVDIEIDPGVSQKVLGLCWNKSGDYFHFKVTEPDSTCTKRTILSARLWDNVGLVAPVVLYAKLLIQELWLIKCDWDETPPPHIVDLWERFCSELPKLNGIQIPRHLGVAQGCTINLLGFGDASERAYGGVVYLQVLKGDEVAVRLVCSKSKVCPLKTVSVARLELCAAVLLAKLMRKVQDNFEPRYNINEVYAFTDSKVALCWIQSSPHRWQTFVANRVVKIIEAIPANCFHHVAGLENPADCLSRGLTPSKLVDHPLWFTGPAWASKHPSEWPLRELDRESIGEVPELKPLAHAATTDVSESPLYSLAQRISSWSRLLRIVVYVYRILKPKPRFSALSRNDLEFAEGKIISSLQSEHFSDDIDKIKSKRYCSPALQKLKPFLDKDGLIRVGGRLSNADMKYSQKHPIVLPRRDHVVNMIVDYFHRKHLHAGPESLMTILRLQYWILSARRVIRDRVAKCNTCFRANPQSSLPLMADLPSCRVNQVNKPFTHTGCDYAGPLQYTPTRGRGVKSRKAWLCIFTCLTTRCLHIEIATELSTANFLAALKRFLARRGPVQCIYSDNGTNFTGANSYMRDLYKFLDGHRPHLEMELAENRIDWKFIPPASPHFGGAWESMVKIVKNHLFKVIGTQILSYEELLTTLAQIEALVNSRPLTALSSDPAEPSALTPAHFLNTAPLLSLPAPLVESGNLRDRHALLDKIVQSFWQRWRAEYLHQLQSRAKWTTPSVPIVTGTVVVIKVDNAPPFSWPLGVVEAVHPSKDGSTRVVTVRTNKGSFVRPVVRLCPLPNQ